MEENTPAVCECQSWHQKLSRRNRMLVISALVQCTLMLLSIVYFAILFHWPHKVEPMKTPEQMYVSTELPSGSSLHSKKLLVIHRFGDISLENGSVVIPRDGNYLISMEGCLNDMSSSNTITVWCQEDDHKRSLLREQTRSGCIRALIVKKLNTPYQVYVERESLKDTFLNFSLGIYLI